VILGPLVIIALLFLVLYIRRLYTHNREYRERIEAQKNLVLLGTAASTLAHEIKNPLSSIRLQTGILSKLCPDVGKGEVGIINEEVERLSSLTYRVNDYLREGKGSPQSFDIVALIRETGMRLCRCNIIKSGCPENALVYADADRMRSVFENLIRNAIESGSEIPEIEIEIEKPPQSARASSGSVIIRIMDRGSGFAEEDGERLFDPFFTRKSTGTGIGLSISKRFVEAAGGGISIANREGGGAVVTVILPTQENETKEEFER
jgi:two-component system sensor histidine kinase HydH